VTRPVPGALPTGSGATLFTVWAPNAQGVDVRLLDPDETVALRPAGDGWFRAEVDGVDPGRRYRYRLDGSDEAPDPASGHQPEGVHGPSEVVDPGFAWTDTGWRGVPLADLVLYELHVGTFTPEGTFDAIIPRLSELAELGVNAIELMPVAAFPGSRNWGYDGVFLYAVQTTYGGPDGLRRLVDAAHAAGVAVCLDVVYNHLGPEGNVLHRFGPYFTDRYRTPWGEAINVDGPGSEQVRAYFVGNALRWFEQFHIDALRLDAVDQIADRSAVHFLAQLSAGAARPAAAADRRERPERPADGHRPRGRWAGHGCAVVGRPAPLSPLAADRRGAGLLCGFRRVMGTGQGVSRRFRLRRAALPLQGTPARCQRTRCGGRTARRLRAESRPDRKQDAGRKADRAGRRRPGAGCRCRRTGVAVRPHALHG
jgi:hypothetical protein